MNICGDFVYLGGIKGRWKPRHLLKGQHTNSHLEALSLNSSKGTVASERGRGDAKDTQGESGSQDFKVSAVVLCVSFVRVFPYKFSITYSSYVKYTIIILIGVVLNLQIALGGMDILMMLIFPIHEHSIYFNLFIYSAVSFFSVL